MRFTQIAPLALGGALLIGATASVAQQPPPAAAPQVGPHGQHAGRPDPAAMAARRADHLRAALQLRPDQEPALKAYLESGRPAQRPAPMDREAMAKMTTPQRLDAHRARMADRLAQLDQRIAATKRFYAQLTPAQQKAFDAIAPQGVGKGGMGMGGRHGMDGRGPGGRG